MKQIFIIALTFSLAACAAVGPAVDRIAQANDAALAAAELEICRGASIGAIMRKYGQDPIKARAWRDMCVEHNSAANEIVK